MTIINPSFNISNETFGWIVAQILYAETAQQKARNNVSPKKEQAHV